MIRMLIGTDKKELLLIVLFCAPDIPRSHITKSLMVMSESCQVQQLMPTKHIADCAF